VFENNRLLEALLIIVVVLAFLQILASSVAAIDVSGLSAWEVKLVDIVQYFFVKVLPTALLGGFAWSLFGYLRYKVGDATISYEMNKFSQTIMWWVGIMTPICAALPPEQGLAVSGVIMAIKSVVSSLISSLSAPQASTPATPVAPS
jgi:hypothetical protein